MWGGARPLSNTRPTQRKRVADDFARLNRNLAGSYELVERLGSGGMSTVYLAKDLKHDREVAIKVLRPEVASTIGSARFLREIQISAQLNHVRIVPLYDSGSADDILYYIMPCVEGESLRDRVNREGPRAGRGALRHKAGEHPPVYRGCSGG